MNVRNFHCRSCNHVFASFAPQNVAEELLSAQCPLCWEFVGLYRAVEPVLKKPSSEWTGGDVLLLLVAGLVGYGVLKEAGVL